jgi:carnosine N-methyltransferase
MAAGNFMEIYGNAQNAGQWDAVITCFFIDTAPVVIE